MFSRLCVDVDHQGNVRGISVEVHGSDGPTTIWTDPVGPFDDVHLALESALLWLGEYVGTQVTLF